MLTKAEALSALEVALLRPSTEGRPLGAERAAVEEHLRASLCEPFEVSARVMPPGFAFAGAGETLVGYCVAQSRGYWLVYQPEHNRFLCFWGDEAASLGAHGVFGSPLYCWAA